MAAKEYWGADIGGSAVKGVKVRRTDGKLEVVAVDVVRLKGEAAPEVSFGRDRRIWIALHELARRNDIRTEPLVISVPARATFVRPFDIPLVTGQPTEQLVQYEVQQHMPFGLDTVIWDYELFGDVQDSKRRDGVMFAVKKEVLNNYLMSLSAANLQADNIQSAPLALYNFVRYDQQVEEPVLVMDVGATCTDMVMMYNGRYTVSSVPAGGDGITRVLQEKFDLSPERAEKAKRYVGRLRLAKEVLEAMLPAMRKYASEIQNAVRRLRSEVGGIVPRKVLLFGGAADTVGLAKMLSQVLECEVEVPKSFKRLEISPEANHAVIEHHFSELGVAVGLALQAAGERSSPINLISAAAATRRIVSRSLPFVAATLGVAAAILLWLGVFGELKADRIASARISLERALKPVEALQREWEKLSAKSPSEKLLEEYARLGEHRLDWIRVLAKLNSILPATNAPARFAREIEKLWLISLTLDGKDNVLQGTSWWGIRARGDRNRDLDFATSAVQKKLEALPGFSDIQMTIAGSRGAQQGLRYVNDLTSKAPAVPVGGQYMMFPVTFKVNLDQLDKGK